MKIRNGKDFFAGLLYVLIGGLAVIFGRDYPIGSTSRMGPGYFPLLVGASLVLVGAVVASRGLTIESRGIERVMLKPLVLVLVSVALFAASIEKLGLVAAILLVVVVGYLANPRPRPIELIVLTVVLTAASVGIFVYGLNLPFRVWPGSG